MRINWKDEFTVKGTIVNLILAAILIACLSSCTTSRHINRTHTTTDSTAVTHTANTATIANTSTLTESLHTIVAIPEVTFDDTADTLAGTEIFDTPEFTATVTPGVNGGKPKIRGVLKPRNVPVDITRVLVSSNNATTSAVLDNTVAVSTESTGVVKDRETEGRFNLNYLWWLLLLLLIPIWKYRKELL